MLRQKQRIPLLNISGQVFSAYTVPLELARAAECWDGDVIAEDTLQYFAAQIGSDMHGIVCIAVA